MIEGKDCFRAALFLIVFGVPQSVSAQGYCSSVSEAGLRFGCAQTLSNHPILNNSPSPTNIYITQFTGAYDGLVWDADWIASSNIEPRLRFSADVKFPDLITQSWRNVFIGSTRTDGVQTDVIATALPFGNSGVDEHIDVTLQFDRLSLENTNLMVLPGRKITNVIETGAIEYFILGSAAAGSKGGELTLNNASLAFNGNGLIGATQFLMAGPVGLVPVIKAEAGSNTLSLGSQANFAERVTVLVNDGASLELTGTELSTRIEGNLNIATGGSISLINNSVLSLLQNDNTELPRSSVIGGSVELDGVNTELLLTAPEVIDGVISIKNGATLTIRERDTGSSSISFLGDNLITLDGPQTSIRGNPTAPEELTLEVGAGTTRFVGAVAPTVGKGLNVNAISIDGGTLDWDDMVTNNAQQNAIKSITITNGGVFQERSSSFGQLEGLNVSNGTLRTHGVLGSYTVNNGINTANFTDAVIDVMGATNVGPGVSAGLRATVINANQLSFSGRNQIKIGISPDGECLLSAGACIPGTTRYAGQLVTNVGNDPQARLSGYDTLLFIPHAVDTTATAADYISGGVNGRYTIATANSSSALTTNLQGLDAAPMTPTAADLSAAGSSLPASLTYIIVNDPVTDGRVDISFLDIGLLNHPTIATGTANTTSYAQLVLNSGNTLTHSDLQRVQTLHPEVYASYMTVALEHSDNLRNMVLANARGNSTGGDRVQGMTETGRSIWLDSSLMRGNVDRTADLAGFSYDLGEIAFGGGLWSNDTVNIGAYIGYGQYSMGAHTSSTSSSNATSKAIHFGTYVTHDTATWSMTGVAGFSLANTETTREAVKGITSNIHKADYDSRTFEAAVRARYLGIRSVGAWQFVPELGLGYAHYTQEAITETGPSATALTINGATAKSLTGSIGINATGPDFSGALKPLAFLRYEHDFLASRDTVHQIDAAFASSSNISQTFTGTHRGSNAISIGFGLSSPVGSSTDASAGLAYTKNTNGDEFGGGLKITWKF